MKEFNKNIIQKSKNLKNDFFYKNFFFFNNTLF